MFKNIFLILICLGFIFSDSTSEARRRRKFKGVIIVNQILRLQGAATNNGQPVLEYAGVKQGDVLATDEKSTMVIRIVGLGIYQLGPNTKFKLTSFSDRNESRFEIFTGEILALYRRPGNHELKTPRGIISLHGNSTFVVSTDHKTAMLCACDGRLHAQNILTSDEMSRRPLPVTVPPSILTTAPTPKTGKAETSLVQSEGPPPILLGGAPSPSAATASASGAVTSASTPQITHALKIEIDNSNIVSQWNHKQFRMSESGIENYSGDLVKSHPEKTINELQSLYELP